jgi:hypothetical protein
VIQALDSVLVLIGAAGVLYYGAYRPIAFIRRTRNATDDRSGRWHLVRAEGVSLVRQMISTGLAAVAILTLALLTGWVLITIVAVPPIVAVAAAFVAAWLAVRLARKRNAADHR